ncbi:Minor extracellular protease vpr [Paramyrothecium foliicola]|nr:Minor extracellular protease vpr [Paramyrothecium foliicola]
MRAVATLTLVSPLLGLVSGHLGRRAQEDNGTRLDSKRYIVEYVKGGANLRGSAPLKEVDVQVIKTYETELFSGAAVETADYTADDLLKLPDVAKVWVNRLVYLDPGNITNSFSDDANSANYTSHHLTRVSGLHERGILGEGVKVGIVDTGILYTHPALGAGFGEGFKVAGGYDFVGDGTWPDAGDKTPDDDPVDTEGHGTHVAGIVAGQSERFSGVAPRATLYGYKVFTSSGYTDDATLIEAFLRAYEDGVDIISASIGGASGWADNAWAVVASRLVEQGVLVTISAGNSGEVGPFYGSSGSSGKNVLAVASTANEVTPAPSFRVNFQQNCRRNTSIIGYIPSVMYFNDQIVDWPIVPTSLDTSITDDACQPFPEGHYNFTGKIPLVRRGGCPIATKRANLYALGAYEILIYNDDQPLVQFGQDSYETIVALIENYSGEAIVKAIAAGAKVTADFSKGLEEIVGLPWAFAARASYFSTWGGLNELQFKPDIAAPGGEIYSTYLGDQWATFSGTSMAAPYVAGVAALYVGLYGGRSAHGPEWAKKLANRIRASGNDVKWWDAEVDYYAPPPQVGTGLIDAFKVINYTTSLDFEPIALNDTANFVSTHEVVLHNGGQEAVEYSFSVNASKGMEILWPEDEGFNSPRIRTLYDLEPVDMPIDVELPDSFTLQPGESKAVSFKFEQPVFEGFSIPLYSGKVFITSSKNESLAVPYMGLGANLKEQMNNMFMKDTEARHSIDWLTIQEKPSWTNEVWGLEEDWVYASVQIKWATRELRWDAADVLQVFEAGWEESSWSYPPKIGEKGFVGSAAYWRHSANRWWSQFADDADPTDSIPFPLYDMNRNGVYGQYRSSFQWHGMLANKTQLEPGNYTMRLAALKPFGVPEKASDWSVWEVPPITILGKFGPRPDWNASP